MRARRAPLDEGTIGRGGRQQQQRRRVGVVVAAAGVDAVVLL
jgi:hypothetical protein